MRRSVLRLVRPDPEPVLRVVTQRESSDCAVACLAMETGSSYEDALRAVCRVDEDGAEDGLFVPKILAAASELGAPMKRKRRVNLEDDNGILHVRIGKSMRHVVILRHGLVVDTDATLWLAEDYVRINRAVVLGILVAE